MDDSQNPRPQKQLSILVPAWEHMQFREICRRHDISPSQAIRRYIREVIAAEDENVPLPRGFLGDPKAAA